MYGLSAALKVYEITCKDTYNAAEERDRLKYEHGEHPNIKLKSLNRMKNISDGFLEMEF